MLLQYFARSPSHSPPREGDLYKILTVFGRTFEIRFGYYADFERLHHEPMPIYPDFIRRPEFTREGLPLATAMQDICGCYRGEPGGDTCAECRFFQRCEDLFGVCTCPARAASTEEREKTG